MSRLLLLAPLRIEQLALGRRPGARVLRTGMGPERARVAAARALADSARAVAVAGLCAGIDPGLHAGDVVCASALIDEAGNRVEVPEAALIAETLRRHGLVVHVGTILCTRRIMSPRQRRDRSDGVLAVDMESVWLAAAAGGRPFAVARVVADQAGRRLLDPRMLVAGARALRNLHRVGGALSEWSLTARSRSSDAHDESAIDIVAGAVAERGAPPYVRKQTVHSEIEGAA